MAAASVAILANCIISSIAFSCNIMLVSGVGAKCVTMSASITGKFYLSFVARSYVLGLFRG